MSALITTPNLDRPDDVYSALVEALEGCSPEAGVKLATRLVLLLANHIGDRVVVQEAIAIAGAGSEV